MAFTSVARRVQLAEENNRVIGMTEKIGIIEMEQTRERKAIVLGRLQDFGLGNPEGIPSSLANASHAELQEIADRDNEALVEPNDFTCTACVDGRKCIHNADGSEPKLRLRRVGGSASNYGVALNADASIVAVLNPEAPLGEQINTVDDFMGYRSAHLGGCGGAIGEIADHEAIHQKSAVLAAVKAFMAVPEVREYLGVDYTDELGERVRVNAGKTAEYLRTMGWDGQKYVDGVKDEVPENVEDLETDPNDHKFHGHKEAKLTVIIGDKTSAQNDEFVWNLCASKEVAEKLAGQRGEEGYTQAIIAELAKHFAVVDRLPVGELPVILQVA